MKINEFDKIIEASFSGDADYEKLEEAFQWISQNVWDHSTYSPRRHDFNAVAEATLICMERWKKFGWNRRGKTAYEYFSWMVNTVYRHHCTWNKQGVKNGLKTKTDKVQKKSDVPTPAESKRWGAVRKSGWKPKTGIGE